MKLVIEPIFETMFLPSSYGFRPGRGCKDALPEADRLNPAPSTRSSPAVSACSALDHTGGTQAR